jgi:hypothetical protein
MAVTTIATNMVWMIYFQQQIGKLLYLSAFTDEMVDLSCSEIPTVPLLG